MSRLSISGLLLCLAAFLAPVLVFGQDGEPAASDALNYRLLQIVEYEGELNEEYQTTGLRAQSSVRVSSMLSGAGMNGPMELDLVGGTRAACRADTRGFRFVDMAIGHQQSTRSFSSDEEGLELPLYLLNATTNLGTPANPEAGWTDQVNLALTDFAPGMVTLSHRIERRAKKGKVPALLMVTTESGPIRFQTLDGSSQVEAEYLARHIYSNMDGSPVLSIALFKARLGGEVVRIEQSQFRAEDSDAQNALYRLPDELILEGLIDSEGETFRKDAYRPDVEKPMPDWGLQAVKAFGVAEAVTASALDRLSERPDTPENQPAHLFAVPAVLTGEAGVLIATDLVVQRDPEVKTYDDPWMHHREETMAKDGDQASRLTSTTDLVSNPDNYTGDVGEDYFLSEDVACLALAEAMSEYGVWTSLSPLLIGAAILGGGSAAAAAAAVAGGGGGGGGDDDSGFVRTLGVSGRIRVGGEEPGCPGAGNSVGGIEVLAISNENEISAQTTTNQTGYFQLALPEGWIGTIEPQPTSLETLIVSESTGEPYVLIIGLTSAILNEDFLYFSGGTVDLDGNLTIPGGLPDPNFADLVSVQIQPLNNAGALSPLLFPNADGSFPMGVGLTEGVEYVATPSLDDYLFSPPDSTFVACGTPSVSFTLQTDSVTGQVIDQNTQGVPGITLSAVDQSGIIPDQDVITDGSGGFTLVLPRNWTGTVFISGPNYTPDDPDVYLADTSDLSALQQITGTVSKGVAARPTPTPRPADNSDGDTVMVADPLEFELAWQGSVDLDLRVKFPNGMIADPSNPGAYRHDDAGGEAAYWSSDRLVIERPVSGVYEVGVVLDGEAGDAGTTSVRVRATQNGSDIAASPLLDEWIDLSGHGSNAAVRTVVFSFAP